VGWLCRVLKICAMGVLANMGAEDSDKGYFDAEKGDPVPSMLTKAWPQWNVDKKPEPGMHVDNMQKYNECTVGMHVAGVY
jgi:hypothetical protein